MSIKTSFSIGDLENLSGIKAHSIRIWERRYNLLTPHRTETNIRAYDIGQLKKLFNISVLLEHGMKISHIAALEQAEMQQRVRELSVEKGEAAPFSNAFKLSMLHFDQELFHNTCNQLLAKMTFRELFLDVFVPLLNDVGMLWTVNTITPAHEHFISTLIKQKLLVNIERLQNMVAEDADNFVLFLPLNEIHEIGLLYIHYELLLKGENSIFLGPSVPVDNLKALQSEFGHIIFISCFTVEPEIEKVQHYVEHIYSEILTPRQEHLHLFGRNTQVLESQSLPKLVHEYTSILELLSAV